MSVSFLASQVTQKYGNILVSTEYQLTGLLLSRDNFELQLDKLEFDASKSAFRVQQGDGS